jgi:acyl-coenzyme A synthetase/AMP-(fatty) acid ligase
MIWSSEAIALARRASGLSLGCAPRDQSMIRLDEVAIAYPGGSMSFSQLHASSSRAARALARLGVGSGERIAGLSKNSSRGSDHV